MILGIGDGDGDGNGGGDGGDLTVALCERNQWCILSPVKCIQ